MSQGHNHANEVLAQRAQELCHVLDKIADLQEQAKTIKAEAKSDGYDMKAFGQIVKELRRGPDFQAEQLTLEAVIDTYRAAVDLPTELEEAQARAREAAGAVPDVAGDDESDGDDA